MPEKKRAIITEEHRREAKALKALWDDGRPRKTQAVFGEVYGLGNQANVGHYLLARSPLNVRAAMAFAAELNCKVADFSPRLAAEMEQLGASAAIGQQEEARDEYEAQLLRMFRELPHDSQDMILSWVNGLHNMVHPEKSDAHPYAHIPAPPATQPPPSIMPPAPAAPKEKTKQGARKVTT